MLAKREREMMADTSYKLAELGGYREHRGQEFNRHILPRCRPLVEAIGHRMAYEAARGSGVCPTTLRLFELLCLAPDTGWRASGDRIITQMFHDSLVKAYDQVLPDMLNAIRESEVNDYITAPIVSDKSWTTFVKELPSFEYPCNGVGGFQPKL